MRNSPANKSLAENGQPQKIPESPSGSLKANGISENPLILSEAKRSRAPGTTFR
jgi:hypothetical protein